MSRSRRSGALGLTSFWGGLATLASGPAIQAELVPEWNGLLQRAAMWPTLLWMSALSVRLHSLASPAAPGPATRAPTHR